MRRRASRSRAGRRPRASSSRTSISVPRGARRTAHALRSRARSRQRGWPSTVGAQAAARACSTLGTRDRAPHRSSAPSEKRCAPGREPPLPRSCRAASGARGAWRPLLGNFSYRASLQKLPKIGVQEPLATLVGRRMCYSRLASGPSRLRAARGLVAADADQDSDADPLAVGLGGGEALRREPLSEGAMRQRPLAHVLAPVLVGAVQVAERLARPLLDDATVFDEVEHAVYLLTVRLRRALHRCGHPEPLALPRETTLHEP